MPDWEISFFPHKCHYCGKKIKRKTPHICVWGHEGGINERYCDPHCARRVREEELRARERREKLHEIIYGGIK